MYEYEACRILRLVLMKGIKGTLENLQHQRNFRNNQIIEQHNWPAWDSWRSEATSCHHAVVSFALPWRMSPWKIDSWGRRDRERTLSYLIDSRVDRISQLTPLCYPVELKVNCNTVIDQITTDARVLVIAFSIVIGNIIVIVQFVVVDVVGLLPKRLWSGFSLPHSWLWHIHTSMINRRRDQLRRRGL